MSELRNRPGNANGFAGRVESPETEEARAAKIGANAKRASIRFIPHPDNTEFNGGMRKSFSYSHYYTTDSSLADDELVIWFTGHKVTIRGHNLLPWHDRIDSHHLDCIAQKDPLQASKGGTEPVCAEMMVEELE